MKILWNYILHSSILLICISFCIAQTDTVTVSPDSTQSRFTITPDSVLQRKSQIKAGSFQPKKSAWLAVGLSAALPGAGQIYNETYWKAPIIWGLGSYWISVWIDLNKNYKSFRDKYSESISTLMPNGNDRYLRLRDWYRDERDKFAWYLGALYFVNLIDAYVGAHLYDFDVSPDLSADGRLVPRVTATIKIQF